MEYEDLPSNVGSTEIGSVHQTDTVQGTQGKEQPTVDLVNDLSLRSMVELCYAWVGLRCEL